MLPEHHHHGCQTNQNEQKREDERECYIKYIKSFQPPHNGAYQKDKSDELFNIVHGYKILIPMLDAIKSTAKTAVAF